jgi:predicted acetyltransferase
LEIRRITAEDYEAHRHIASLAFARGKTPEFTPEVYDQPDRTRIGVYENGRLQATLGIVDFQYIFGESRRPCGGIAGVASDPAMRGRGFAGTLVKRSLELMREKGQYLSSLWPFDFRFYRAFGWEWTGETRRFTVPLDLVPSTRETDFVEGVYENAVEVVSPIYERFAEQYNGMVLRSRKRWEQHLAPVDGRRRAVYAYRREGEIEGYVTIRYGDKEEDLHADDLIALTRRACEGLLGVARRHAMTASKLHFAAPMNHIFPSILTHWDVETKLQPAAMGRVVDVQAALEAQRPSERLRGELVAAIADEHAPWNAGTWRITVEGGRVQVERSSREAGVSLDIQALTQAYWGTPSLLDLRRWDRVAVRDDSHFAVLSALLPPAPVWLHDDF